MHRNRLLGLLVAAAVAAMTAKLHGQSPEAVRVAPPGGAAATVAPAMPPAGDVGVDEKLGAMVALDVALRDEDGKSITLKQIVDKPTILTLNYFRCAGICTPLLNGLTDSLNAIPLEPARDFQVITVSFDPTDTPEIATRKRANYLKQMTRPFPPQGWRFLTGEGSATKQVAESVGFKFRQEGQDFVHAGVIMVLSPEGKVTRYMYGTSFLPSDLQMAVYEAARGEARPTISKFLKFCFSYDPAGKRYVFNMTRVVGAMTIVLVGGFLLVLIVKGSLRRAGSDEKTVASMTKATSDPESAHTSSQNPRASS